MKADLRRILDNNKIMIIDGSMSTPLERMGADLNDELWTAKVLFSVLTVVQHEVISIYILDQNNNLQEMNKFFLQIVIKQYQTTALCLLFVHFKNYYR